MPKRVVTTDGTVLFTGQDIKDGQNVWQSIGGQEVGTIWGHGAYVAPDWSADWLHREATWLLEPLGRRSPAARPTSRLDAETQAVLRQRLKKEIRSNTYNPQTGDLVVSPLRAEAIKAVGAHYAALFGDDPDLKRPAQGLRHPRQHHQDPGAAAADERASSSGRPGPAAPSGPAARSPTPRTGRPSR